MRWRLAIGALALAACGGPGAGDAPVGVAVEAVRAKPVVDYPHAFARREKVPPFIYSARLAPRGDGYLAAWGESVSFVRSSVRARFLGADGAPLGSAPFTLGEGALVFGAACAPAGDCLVLWDGGVTPVTEAGAGKPIAFGGTESLVAYDAAAAAYVIAWQAKARGVMMLHFQNGAPIETEPVPLTIAGAKLDALACSPADGCLVAFSNAGLPETASGGAIVTATAVTHPFPLGDSPLVSLTWGGGVYFGVAPAADGFAFTRFGVDGTALDPAPRPLTFSEPASHLAGAAFDGKAFTLLAYDDTSTNVVSSAARVLADGKPATPAGFKLDGLGEPFAFTCGDKGCAAAVDFADDHEGGLSAVAITHDVPAAPHAITESVASQKLEAAFPFGDKVFVAWNESDVVRTRWLTSDASAAGPIVDIGGAAFVEAGTSDADAGLLVDVGKHGALSTRVVSRAGVGAERPIEARAATLPIPARFAWLDDTAPDGTLTLRRFDADGRTLDADPTPIAGPLVKKQYAAFGTIARSGDVFVVVSVAGPPDKILVTRVRDTGEIIDQASRGFGLHGGIACSPTECLLSEEGQFGRPETKPAEVRLARFASHADKLAFNVSTLDTGTAGPVAWDGAHFVTTYVRDDELRVARIDDDGPVIGERLLQNDIPTFLVPSGEGHALLFAQVFDATSSRRDEEANVSLVLVDGFARGGLGDGVVGAGGGGCAVVAMGHDSSAREAVALAVLLAAAAHRLRARRRDAVG